MLYLYMILGLIFNLLWKGLGSKPHLGENGLTLKLNWFSFNSYKN